MRPIDSPPADKIEQVEARDRLPMSTLLGAALFCVVFWSAVGVFVVEVVL